MTYPASVQEGHASRPTIRLRALGTGL